MSKTMTHDAITHNPTPMNMATTKPQQAVADMTMYCATAQEAKITNLQDREDTDGQVG